MRNFGPQLFLFLLVLTAAITLACGSPTSPISSAGCTSAGSANTSGILQSIALCPATADAKDYTNGEVQFMATGYYDTKPSPAVAQDITWGVCYQNAPTSAVSMNTGGLAQCTAGASGAYNVFASQLTECNAITACGGGCQIAGFAKLTCP
jgi:hypothetical protein